MGAAVLVFRGPPRESPLYKVNTARRPNRKPRRSTADPAERNGGRHYVYPRKSVSTAEDELLFRLEADLIMHT